MNTLQTQDSSSGLTIASVKRIHGRAELLLSNGESLSMPRAMLKERPYRSGMPFDFDAFKTFLRDRSYPFAMDKAVRLLASRARTEREIVDALRKNAYPEETIARVMARLHEVHYLDDADFADHWSAARAAKGLGTRRIRMELRQKGIDSDTIDEVISSLDEDTLMASAQSAAQKAARGKDLSSVSDRQKILAALARRGFDYTLSRRALEQIISNSAEE